MIAKSTIVLGAGLLLASLPALGANETHSVAPVSLPSAFIKCPGVTNIPMTADAEQALPLTVTDQLRCGEVVSILADTEGYTAHVRTSDGHDGYVARMYLFETEATAPELAQRHVSSATPVNGIVRWSAGAPGCDEFLSHGRHVESITANGVTVQVSIQDTGWKYRANIAISNQSSDRLDVTPGIITLDELQPSLRTLPATDITKIARTSTHQVLWTVANAVPSPSAVSAQERGASEVQRLAYRNSPTLDYMNPQMTLTSSRPGASGRTESVDVQAIALKYVSLPEGQATAGVMWFSREAVARELSMRVPVGDMVFDFAFAFEQKK
jgi:hypothetical protein